jgi:hypothetical protein
LVSFYADELMLKEVCRPWCHLRTVFSADELRHSLSRVNRHLTYVYCDIAADVFYAHFGFCKCVLWYCRRCVLCTLWVLQV